MSASTVEYQTTSLQCIHNIKDLIIKFQKRSKYFVFWTFTISSAPVNKNHAEVVIWLVLSELLRLSALSNFYMTLMCWQTFQSCYQL